jgi:hypothetical protein
LFKQTYTFHELFQSQYFACIFQCIILSLIYQKYIFNLKLTLSSDQPRALKNATWFNLLGEYIFCKMTICILNDYQKYTFHESYNSDALLFSPNDPFFYFNLQFTFNNRAHWFVTNTLSFCVHTRSNSCLFQVATAGETNFHLIIEDSLFHCCSANVENIHTDSSIRRAAFYRGCYVHSNKTTLCSTKPKKELSMLPEWLWWCN